MLSVEYRKQLLSILKEELNEIEQVEETNRTPEMNTKKEELEKQIKGLINFLIRYEIAKLLGLENESFYVDNNFIGIEEENIDNLSDEDKNKFNSLVSKLPKEQLQSFKIRRQMTNIIYGKNNDSENNLKDKLKDIEKEDPSKAIFNLNQNEIDAFNRLASELERLNYEEIDYDYKKIAQEKLQDAYNKLNTTDAAQYNNLSNRYYGVIDRLIKMDGSESTQTFSPAQNKDLLKTLREKYPNLNIEPSEIVLGGLISEIVAGNLSEDVTNDYTQYVTLSLSKFANDETKRPFVEQTINQMDNSINSLSRQVNQNQGNTDQYNEQLGKIIMLRIEAANKIHKIGDRDLSIQDNELQTYFDYLNNNYDNLEEDKKNKINSYLNTGISRNISDPRNVDIINNMFQGMTNSNFERDLQANYHNNNYVKFPHNNMTTYQSLVSDQIKELENKRRKIESKDTNSERKDIKNEARIREINKEIEELRNILVEYDSKRLDRTNEKYNKKTDRIIEISSEIEDLKELKSQINSRFRKKRIDKKVSKKQEKINKLKQSQVKIEQKQKKIMKPKLKKAQKENKQDRRYESMYEEYESRSQDYAHMKEYEQNSNKLFSGIRERIYEYKENKYQNKSEKFQELLQELRNGQVYNNGSNTITLTKDYLYQKRNQNQQSIQLT